VDDKCLIVLIQLVDPKMWLIKRNSRLHLFRLTVFTLTLDLSVLDKFL
jgi:hypothetical protein